MGVYDDPGDRLVAVTPSDSTDLSGARGIFVGGEGNVAVRMIGDPSTTVTLTGVVAATTATNITAID